MPPKVEELAEVNPTPEDAEPIESETSKDIEHTTQSTPVVTKETTAKDDKDVAPSVPAKDEESRLDAPVKPPRPLSPFEQAEATLAEAFPGIDEKVRRAVLVASAGDVEAAFAALLSMSDPDFKPEEAIALSKQNSIKSDQEKQFKSQQQAQIDEDERLARKLAREYSSGGSRRSGQQSRSSFGTGRYDDPLPAQPERSFLDDDLPEIKRSLEEGFQETKEKVNSWVANLRNKIVDSQQQASPGSTLFGAFGKNDNDNAQSRTSQRERRFDGDPDEIHDDFQGISLRDEDLYSAPPPPPKRPSATTASVASVQPVSALGDSTTTKWEPLKTSETNETGDKDAFFIGESDDDDLGEEGEEAAETEGKADKTVKADTKA